MSAYGRQVRRRPAEPDRDQRPVAARRRGPLEADFQAMVVNLATRLGWLVYHTHDSRHSPAGFPDLILVRGDRLMAIECKRQGEEPTTAQLEWLRALDRVQTVTSYVARPIGDQPIGDWSEIEAVLR